MGSVGEPSKGHVGGGGGAVVVVGTVVVVVEMVVVGALFALPPPLHAATTNSDAAARAIQRRLLRGNVSWPPSCDGSCDETTVARTSQTRGDADSSVQVAQRLVPT